MTLGLRDKVVIVTGAGQGIGEACARALAAEVARVVVNDIDAARADAVVEALRAQGAQAVASHDDISTWDGAGTLIEVATKTWGRLDGLVNNAGRMMVARVEDMAPADLNAMIGVNVVGTIACAVHAIRVMRSQGAGAIVNITSGAHAGQPNLSAYGATKGAVASFTFGAAIDLQGTAVRINAVSPIGETGMRGVMDAFRASNGQALSRDAGPPPENNAPVILYLLSEASRHVHGQIVRVDGPRLSIMSHPAICSPSAFNEHWALQGVSDAFADILSARQQPLGIAEWADDAPGPALRA